MIPVAQYILFKDIKGNLFIANFLWISLCVWNRKMLDVKLYYIIQQRFPTPGLYYSLINTEFVKKRKKTKNTEFVFFQSSV